MNFARTARSLAPLALLVSLFLGIFSPNAAAQDRFREFEDKYKAAMKINATSDMTQLLRQYNYEAVIVAIDKCESISNQGSDDLETFVAALKGGWKRAYKSDFVEKIYVYFSLLDPQVKRLRTKLKKDYDSSVARVNLNLQGDKDGPTFVLLAAEFAAFAKEFAGIGDRYFESECWIRYGSCFETSNRGPGADLIKATGAYQKALAARDEIELKDNRYREVKSIFDIYEKKGYLREGAVGGGSDGEDGAGAGPSSLDAGEGTEIVLTFEAVADAEKIQRMNFFADSIYMMWQQVGLKKKGSLAEIIGVKEAPRLVRVGSGDIRVDQDGDGKGESDGEEKIPFTGKPAVVEMTLGSGKEKRQWAILATIGLEQDFYQDIQLNASPQDDYHTVYILPAGSMVGEIAGTQVRVLDDNMNGSYGDPPVDWGHTGISDGYFQRDMDGFVVGSEKRARPWSELQNIDGQWYKLESVDKGTKLYASPLEVETGKLKLSLKGPKVNWCVVRGRGAYENCYFDLMQNGSSGVELPVGTWELYMGEVRQGKKRQTIKALILPQNLKAAPAWEVAPGKTTKAELGGTFSFDFRVDADEETLTVVGKTIAVTGGFGERYERIWGARVKPEVLWRKKGAKRGGSSEKMDIIGDQFKMSELGWEAAWKPLDYMATHNSSEGVEVQLFSKKNKLFGKIQSEWR